MAQKRMFSLQVVDTDRFTDMPTSAQALYFHLGMHGDDDGFVSSPKKIQRAAGCNDDDMRLLAAKGFIIPFDSGVIVITDWRLNNDLKNDRYKETIYQDEKAMLRPDKSGKYLLGSNLVPDCIQIVSKVEPQHNITKHNIAEHNIEGAGKPPRSPKKEKFVKPTIEEVTAYCRENGISVDAARFCDFYESNGWKVGKSSMKSWQAAARNWGRRDAPPQKQELPPGVRLVVGADGISRFVDEGAD